MPHPENDPRHAHLEFIAEGRVTSRRKQQPPPPPRPSTERRGQMGAQLRDRLDVIETQARSLPQPAGIQPHLVFRVPLVEGASPGGLVGKLESAGLTVVGIDPDRAIIAFRDEVDLREFRAGVDRYADGPRINPNTGQPRGSTPWDILDVIDGQQMRLLGPSDRVGRRIAGEIGDRGERIDPQRLYVVDLELWHPGSRGEANSLLAEVRRLVENQADSEERIRDTFVGKSLCLLKVSVRGAKLGQLLDLSTIAEVELPPVPVFDAAMAERAVARQFPTPPAPPKEGPRVCVVDSGISIKHPLLESNIGHYDSVLTATTSGIDAHGHGTAVAGIAVFGDVRECYTAGSFASPVWVFSARVLNDRNGFDDQDLVVRQMERAIKTFQAEPYRCRVFNISIGAEGPWLEDLQSVWAECLDHLAREYKVLIVVSSGNHGMGEGDVTHRAEEVVVEYPRYFFDDSECRLCEPATAAIALTVGGLAQHDVPAVPSGSSGGGASITRPVARVGQPAPMTRIGPGINGAIKPEFVAPAGNKLFAGVGSQRRIQADSGLATMSFAHDWASGNLFRFDNGTSFAAPRVARIASLVWSRLEEIFGEEVDPNTVRAVLATAANPPSATRALIEPLQDEEGVRRVCGYGEIDEDFALNSGDNRVTLVAQGQIEIDTFQIFAVPIPEEFLNASGTKRVIVGLAFDPPVRRRRADYLGVEMDFALLRNMTVDKIVEHYRAVSRTERQEAKRTGIKLPGALGDRRRCELKPGPKTLENSTLQRAEWSFKRGDKEDGDTYYLVVRASRKWAPQDVTHQDFGLAVTLCVENEIQLYERIRDRLRPRVRA